MSHIQEIILKKSLDSFKKSYLPPTVGTTSNVIIDYFQSYGSIAFDVKIRNLDSTNSLTYNANRQIDVTVPSGVTDVINSTPIETITISPNAGTGSFTVEALGVLYNDLVT